ncbi:hypothetical protein E2C01_101204 [Portunus trituberculatus]|uniref:Uncharacterized protein n=1 Tax=Portunus trituberculatus TaxID=210409 RepID=A0A5B7KJW3_PORTR|nr:hypothetical protein [Portunus trituberculatus]
MALTSTPPYLPSSVVHVIPTLTTAALSTWGIALDTFHVWHRVKGSIENNVHTARHSGRAQHAGDHDGAFLHYIKIGRQ